MERFSKKKFRVKQAILDLINLSFLTKAHPSLLQNTGLAIKNRVNIFSAWLWLDHLVSCLKKKTLLSYTAFAFKLAFFIN